jgi:hypothetical protein
MQKAAKLKLRSVARKRDGADSAGIGPVLLVAGPEPGIFDDIL